ncbi:MAG: CmpA/NrtA family ABC transporter substrate-binding protein [Chthoniobacteraceae bacterium]
MVKPLRLGFIALSDCAPIVMAQELGLFKKHGLNVELSREAGWATIRDKVIYRELEAAHATAPMVFGATLGLGCVQVPCITGLLLNLNGIGITISERLWRKGVRDGESLGRYAREQSEPLVFGVVLPFSSHNFLMRDWLTRHGLVIGRHAQIAVVPPAQMFHNLQAGHLDGYCVGEPWNSMAVASKIGWCAAVGSELSPRHPEKVLMVRQDFATSREGEHLALLMALIESCRFCDLPENRERIAEVLAEPQYVNAPIETIRMGLTGRFDFGHGRVEKFPDFHVFSRGDANEPLPEKAEWVIKHMESCGLLKGSAAEVLNVAGEVFRRDIYHQALSRLSASQPKQTTTE